MAAQKKSTKTEEKKEPESKPGVPTVDVNAPLKIEEASSPSPEPKKEPEPKKSDEETAESQSSEKQESEETKTNEESPGEPLRPDSGQASNVSEPEEPQTEKSGKKLFFAGTVIATAIISSAITFLFLYIKNPPAKEKETPSVEVVATPTEEPKTKFDRSEWSFEVLNGSGVAGAASDAAGKLEELGYKVIKTGNAEDSNYEESELYVSEDLKDDAKEVLKDLKEKFGIASVSGDLEDSTASARLIVGKD